MFNRPEATRQSLKQVYDAQPSALYLIADGPRNGVDGEDALCQQTRNIAESFDWACPVHTLYAEENMGLKPRVISGLDWVFGQEESAIVIEDDNFADPSFFRFATEMLDKYRASAHIGIVSGNNFLGTKRLTDHSYYFSSDVRVWGWATWSHVWRDFSANGLARNWEPKHLEQLVQKVPSRARRRALLGDAHRMDNLSSWALLFVLHCLSRGYVNVVPEKNLVANVGFGADSTHTKFESFTAGLRAETVEFPLRHPAVVAVQQREGAVQDRETLFKWLTFPLFHPFDFLGRIIRYFRSR